MNKLKILYISNSKNIGGGNRSLMSMINKVKIQGHDVIVTVPDKGNFLDLLIKQHIEYSILDHHIPQKNSKINFFIKLINYIKLIYFYSPDIIHANDLFCYAIASIAAKIFRIPVICHMRYSVDRSSVDYYLKTMPHALVFNSRYLKNLFNKNNSNFSAKVRKKVIYNFFDPDKYYCPEERSIVRKKWGYEHEFVVGLVGNLSPQKGHKTFLLMAKELLKVSKKFRFLIIGEDLDPLESNLLGLKESINQLELEDYITWLGFEDNVGQVLSGLDTLVVPSSYEPFGRVAVEGLMAGLPVVASNTGGLAEIVEEAPYGFLAHPEDYIEFASQIKKIFKEKRRYPINNNRKYATLRFGQDVNYGKLENLYYSIV